MMIRILIADDDVSYLDAFCEGMQALGHQAIGVTHGALVLEQLSSEHFDIVFLDVVMSGGGAITLAHQVHEFDPGLPIVVITGRRELIGSPLFQEGLRMVSAKVEKSVTLADLDQLVRRLVNSKASVNE